MMALDIVTLEEAKEFLRVDFEDEDTFIINLINIAYEVIGDSIDNFSDKLVSEKFKRKLNLCMLTFINDAYENRTMLEDKKNNYNLINKTLLTQMQYSNT